MPVYTPEQLDALDTLETTRARHYSRMLARGATPGTVAAMLALDVALNPGLGQSQGVGLHECHGPGCELFTDVPLRDEDAVWWVGDQAPTYCSQECLDNASEEYGTRIFPASAGACDTYRLNTDQWVR